MLCKVTHCAVVVVSVGELVTDHCPQNYTTSCRDGTYRDGTYRLWGEVKIGEGVQPDKELLHQFLNLSVPLVFLVLLHCLHMQR